MKIEKITYQRLFPLGIYQNERIGIEVQVDEGENPAEIFLKAKEQVMQFFKETNPELYARVTEEPITQIENAPVLDRVELLAKDILSCTDLRVAESYRLIAKSHPKLQVSYDYIVAKLSKQTA